MVGSKRSGLVTLICLSANLWTLSQPSDATSDSGKFRRIEVAEYHRALDRALVSDLDAGPEIAARAALAIGRTKRRAGIPVLTAHLGVKPVPVRAMCAYGLGLIGDPSSLAAERKLALADPNSAVRYAAVDAVGRIVRASPGLASEVVAAGLERSLRSDPDPFVRAHAAAQLEAFAAATEAPQVVRELERALARERDSAVRWHVMWAIFRGFAERSDPVVLNSAVHDREELVRVEALRAWGRRPDADPALLRRIARDDPSWRVQFEAREALRLRLGLPKSTHLTVDPPGVRLPPLPVPAFGAPATLPAVTNADRAGRPRAPDPAVFPVPAVLPQTAQQMNGPLPGPHPRALIRTTRGDVVVRLYPEWAPATVANFLALARRGYFDGNRWFRIVPDFVVQTGDPHDNGDGDAGYTLPAEENPLEQRSFVISMGLNYAGKKAIRDSAGTQFYLTLSPQLHLDQAFSVFGEVESGEAVLAHLVERDRMLAVRRIADD
jgi:peptidyl-prolyl cis-trans isomerase B (cyclophilin B)